MDFNYFLPTKILFGPGKLNELANETMPGKKALIVISAGKSVRTNGSLDRLIRILKTKKIDVALYDKILPNPIKTHIMEGAKLAKDEGCDFVIGLGGGSSIDAAKNIAVMAANPGDLWDYMSGGSGKGLPLKFPPLPIVAITTTAGTGTEADNFAVTTNEETNEKIGFGHPGIFPALSVVDPELMLSIPANLTAYQGFDAFFHASEGFISKAANPMSDIFALKSIELIAKYLPVCVKDGNNLEARMQVAFANTLAGFVESTSRLTSQHAMEHSLSAHHPKLAHGAGLIMLSESFFTFFASKVPEERYVSMARAMGADEKELSGKEPALSFVKALVRLQEACGVRDLKMSDYGIQKEDAPMLAEHARTVMSALFRMDRHTLSLQETIEILDKAFK